MSNPIAVSNFVSGKNMGRGNLSCGHQFFDGQMVVRWPQV